MGSTPEAVVAEFFAQWGKSWDDLSAAFPRWIADDITWIQSGIPDIHSRDEATGLLYGVHDGLGVEKIEVIITHIASKGDLVFTERIDHFRRADGTIILTAEVTGVQKVNAAGKITWWREYFDPRDMLALMGG